jgi:hypothetical protein
VSGIPNSARRSLKDTLPAFLIFENPERLFYKGGLSPGAGLADAQEGRGKRVVAVKETVPGGLDKGSIGNKFANIRDTISAKKAIKRQAKIDATIF